MPLFSSNPRQSRAAGDPPEVPESLLVYAVGDVHGEFRLLDRMLALIAEDAAERTAGRVLLVLMGDVIDRGPDSRAVLERLVHDPLPGGEFRLLRGNHEQEFLNFLANPAKAVSWLAFGGLATLASYGIRPPAGNGDPRRFEALRDELLLRQPESHRRLIEGSCLSLVLGDYAFVHAGIRPGLPLAEQRPDDLLWIRDPFLGAACRHEKVIVHGHTVVATPELLPNRIAIDTGAYATGCLTALVLAGRGQGLLQVTA